MKRIDRTLAGMLAFLTRFCSAAPDQPEEESRVTRLTNSTYLNTYIEP